MAQLHDLLERLFNDGMNGGDESVIDEVLAEDYKNHSFSAHGREAMKAVIGEFRTAFPDINITVEERMIDGDRAAQRGHFTGTHKEAFMGIVASGRQVTVPFMDWWVARDGLLAENWVVLDVAQIVDR
jgi:steroid delta-isomerase-like uncharacterized protein